MSWYYDLVSSLQLPKRLGRGEGRVMRRPAKPRFLTPVSLTRKPAAQMFWHLASHKESLERDKPSKAPPAKPSRRLANSAPPYGTPGCSDATTLQCRALDCCVSREDVYFILSVLLFSSVHFHYYYPETQSHLHTIYWNWPGGSASLRRGELQCHNIQHSVLSSVCLFVSLSH
jgi:hypothetical protein